VYRWIIAVAVGVLAVAILGAGCGDDGESTASASVTKAQFTKEANSICAERGKEQKAAFENYGEEVRAASKDGEVTPKMERKVADELIEETIIPSLEDQLDQMEEIGAPAADEAEIARMLRSLSLGIEELKEGGVRMLVEGGKLMDFKNEASAYGLNCES
jgi:hypothetical protein